MLLGKWQQIDTLAVGGAGQEMQQNYFAVAGARIGDTASNSTIKGTQHGKNELTVDGSRIFVGNISAASNIATLSQDKTTL